MYLSLHNVQLKSVNSNLYQRTSGASEKGVLRIKEERKKLEYRLSDFILFYKNKVPRNLLTFNRSY